MMLETRDKVYRTLILLCSCAVQMRYHCGVGKLAILVARGYRRQGMLDRCHPGQLCPYTLVKTTS